MKEEEPVLNNCFYDDLDEHIRQTRMLKLNVFPEDLAEAIYFFCL